MEFGMTLFRVFDSIGLGMLLMMEGPERELAYQAIETLRGN